LLGAAVGATAGAVSGALTDVGINNNFMKEIANGFQNRSSALFVLARKVTPDKVLEELEGSGGKIFQTSLTHEEEAKLQAALDAAGPVGVT
jgi:uncharacterized membrane protein